MIRVGVIGAGSIGREYAMRYLIEEAGVEVSISLLCAILLI